MTAKSKVKSSQELGKTAQLLERLLTATLTAFVSDVILLIVLAFCAAHLVHILTDRFT